MTSLSFLCWNQAWRSTLIEGDWLPRYLSSYWTFIGSLNQSFWRVDAWLVELNSVELRTFFSKFVNRHLRSLDEKVWFDFPELWRRRSKKLSVLLWRDPLNWLRNICVSIILSVDQNTQDTCNLSCYFVVVYGVNSILYQRGIYPPETFQPSEHFGLYIFTSTDDKITSFLNTVLGQIQEWLIQRKVHKITLVITNVNTKEVLEKWDFKVDYEDQKTNGINSNVKAELSEVETKDMKTIQKEIREVIRQITGNVWLRIKVLNRAWIFSLTMYFLIWNIFAGTVSFLPLLDCLCSFDILTYTVPDCDIPNQWDETQPVFIANSQEVQLRSFSTSIHKMDTVVSYKNTWAYLFIFYMHQL